MNYTLGCYEKSMPNDLSMEEKLKHVKNAGFDFMEISIDETGEKLARLDWDREKRRELVNLMYDTGLPIRSMCLSGHRKYPLGSEDGNIRAQGLDIMRKAIGFSDDLGIRIIQIAGYDEYYKPSNLKTEELFTENLQKSVDWASQSGIILAFETMETNFMNTVEKAMRFVDLIQSPFLQVYPDVGNITNAALSQNGDVLADLKRGAGHIAAVHLKETKLDVFREVPFGHGHVDFPALIRTAMGKGARRFMAEFWCVPGLAWREQMKQANIFLRRQFETACDL